MDINANEFNELLESIRVSYGYDFTGYSQSSVKRRIIHFANNRRMNSLKELQRIILKDENTFEEFVQELSVTVTELFRDPLFFESLREKVLGRLNTYPVIKIWIAGCATGEEVYSIAILLKEEALLDRAIIYATDINQKSIQVAKEGIYGLEKMKMYTSNYQSAGGKTSLSEYYTAKYNSILFDKSLKKNIVFSPHNLTMDKSFNEFQLILCRNVLIYFNQDLQKKVIQLFFDSLCPFGFLALGNKESLLFSDKKRWFGEIDKQEKIYIKLSGLNESSSKKTANGKSI